MKPSLLRTYMRRHGNPGVLAVGLYLGLSHLWSRHRTATIVAGCSALSLSGWLCVRLASTASSKSTLSRVAHAAKPAETMQTADIPTIPYGAPLFQRARQVVRLEQIREEENQYPGEYLWLSDTELFFTDDVSSQPDNTPKRIGHCYQYNIRTGKKRALKRLEQTRSFVDCLVNVAPDGKRLLWYKNSHDPRTLQIAALDGSDYRQWPFNTNGESGLDWTRDSRHWIEVKRPLEEALPVEITVHDALHPADNRHFTPTADSFESVPCIYGFGDNLVSIQEPEPTDITSSLEVVIASPPPHIRRIRTARIVLPPELHNPNIAGVLLSPDTRQVALIVGHGGSAPTSGRSDANLPEARNVQRRDYSLLICRVDGSEMRSLGAWQESVTSDTALELDRLQWLPSGKKLSFCYRGALYTVAAE